MACMHRFCKECIESYVRSVGGKKECPTCRSPCSTRRSLREDLNFDKLIATLITDLEEYEREEFSLSREEKIKNVQLQASIAEIFARQSNAGHRRQRKTFKGTWGEASTPPELPENNGSCARGTEGLSWARRMRSRHVSASDSQVGTRTARLNKLVNHLDNLNMDDNKTVEYMQMDEGKQ